MRASLPARVAQLPLALCFVAVRMCRRNVTGSDANPTLLKFADLGLVDAGVPRREEGVDVALRDARRRRHRAEVALDLRGRLSLLELTFTNNCRVHWNSAYSDSLVLSRGVTISGVVCI